MDEQQPLGQITAEQFRQLRQVFERALEQPVDRRAAWLEAACGGDRALEHQVKGMLAAAAQRHPLLDTPDGETTPSSHAASPHGGRLRQGTLVGGRFRILALAGRGGMGEVYRAADHELGQIVALKFLTRCRSERARHRLRSEVRLARQVSHPNVCRVYDIGEADGELYLSMEYIEGEDLATQLKRTPGLPLTGAISIARRLCAGLAAAHARGVLHRDLKPGNIMVDRDGEVRITDFGLATGADDPLRAGDVRSGTPAYMAPEQLDGRDATVRSDLYALGLVLYEMFAGRAPHDARDATELLRLRESTRPTPPSVHVPGLEPEIEHAILGCLEPDAGMRPASALEVAAAFPGADPLAEALALGQTPSPDLVAAVGPKVRLRPVTALALLAITVAGLAAMLMLTKHTHIVSMVPMHKAPEALAANARDIVSRLGYGDPDTEVAYGFRHERGYIEYHSPKLLSNVSRIEQWTRVLTVRPAPVSFWYAQTRGPLVPPLAGLESGTARPLDRLPAVRNGVAVDLDLDGRLLRFLGPPIAEHAVAAAPGAPDWRDLFTAAGLDPERFESAEPRVGTAARGDSRAAWTGFYPDRPDLPVRVEASALGSTVTTFEVLFPWTDREPALPMPTDALGATLLIVIWTAPFFGARQNWVKRRVDLHGALQIGGVAFVANIAFLLLIAHDPVNSFVYRTILWVSLGIGAWAAATYAAVEPWTRRWWPHAMIGWARVMAGRWRDPVVAHDVLVAVAVLVVYRCLYLLVLAVHIQQGGDPAGVADFGSQRAGFALWQLMGARFTVATALVSVSLGILTATALLFVVVMFRLLLRHPWLAMLATGVFGYIWSSAASDALPLLTIAVGIGVALRFGFLALVVLSCTERMLAQSILTTDVGMWYGRSSLIAVVLVATFAAWAARTAVGFTPADHHLHSGHLRALR